MPRPVLTAIRTCPGFSAVSYVEATWYVAERLSGWADAVTREFIDTGRDAAARRYGFDIWHLDRMCAETASATSELRDETPPVHGDVPAPAESSPAHRPRTAPPATSRTAPTNPPPRGAWHVRTPPRNRPPVARFAPMANRAATAAYAAYWLP
ncbi:hypothetical protein [Streptomyces sp. NPDC096339]|uniref:hypothetical protein n=1 Tax=Streptomyces sp. NPDC096339 TaxID=3366086 RepID=UPI00383018D7